MARLIYACRFELRPSAIMGSVAAAYAEWIKRRYTKRERLFDITVDLWSDSYPITLPEHHALKINRYNAESGEVLAVDWSHPDDSDAHLRWKNEIRIGRFDDQCSVEHLISLESVEYQISPAQFVLGSPSVIRHLCTHHEVHVGEMRIRATPYTLTEEGITDFINLLKSPLRSLPVILISPYARNDANLLDASALAQRLAGVAVVVVASNADVTWSIIDHIGRTLSCFNGGVRLYWPGFNINNDPRRHPLYLGLNMSKYGPAAVARSIETSVFTVATFRFVHNKKVSQIIESAEHAQRIQQIEQKTISGINWETYAIELDTELSKAQQRIFELEAENENLKVNQQIYLSNRQLGDVTEDIVFHENFVPRSVLDAVENSKTVHENLIILDSAIDSAQDSPYQRPSEITEALADLNELAAGLSARNAKKGHVGDLRQSLKNRGWKRCSMHISDQTRSRYRNNYTFLYKGQYIIFEPHITLGSGDANSCASIHFILDDSIGKIVVAHVGRHLPNMST